MLNNNSLIPNNKQAQKYLFRLISQPQYPFQF